MRKPTGDVVAKTNTQQEALEFFSSETIRQQLQAAGLDSFEAIWVLEAEWVEKPNFARQGWSGVGRMELNSATRPPIGVYLKRQENHGYRSLQNPFRCQPTAYREYQALIAMQMAAITVPEILYYGERHLDKKMQAVLMTREVPQSIPLDDYIRRANERPPAEVRRVIQDTADLIGKLHRHHFQHSALYGKHVLISGFDPHKFPPHAEQRLVPCLIDVEKTRRRLSHIAIAVRDLSQFHRRVPWAETQWDTFLGQYVIISRMGRLKPILSWLIQQKARRKQARRQPSGRS